MKFQKMLTPLAWVLRGILFVRNGLFDLGLRKVKVLPGGPTISVGNVAVGGTGKSPIVIRIAEYILAKGGRPAILTRGYRSGLARGDSAVLFGDSLIIEPKRSVRFTPDEAAMQAAVLARVPIVVGARRFEAAERFLKERPDLAPTHWILDDGFQRRQIHRDLDIVLLDASDPDADGGLLPVGRLREPMSALRRADAAFFTRVQKNAPTARQRQRVEEMVALTRDVKFSDGRPVPVEGAPPFSHSEGLSPALPVLAVCAIATPNRFLSGLKRLGLSVGSVVTGSDHSLFDKDLIHAKAVGHAAIMTTAKDYWRDPALFRGLSIPVYVIPLNLDLSNEDLSSLFAKSGKGFSFLNDSRGSSQDGNKSP